ncbi:CBS domain-containing protein [Pseudochelatococcus lubricantis]|uniref:CBS domain-containing protein n=1 Tax=Pseudochelatococcus lubricantis TaxID=1538102 RepID=UPI0035EF9C9D
MQVSEIMSRDIHLVNPDDTIVQVAKMMAENDIGFLPVGENDRLVGTITDRDIVVRYVAGGRNGDARVRDVMTADVKYCFEDEDIDDVTRNMGDIQVRRLPVVNRDKRLTGVVSLADTAHQNPSVAGSCLKDITAPGGPTSQTG